uniref:Uncharacterized protein n=1 Tax=Panagrolaimus sp. PS1159 TaxID=55785 RepID=A0AC35GWK5_9BILA
MVAVAPNVSIGPAQLLYRRVETPFEQTSVVKYVEYAPIKKNITQKTIMDKSGIILASPNYGLATLTNNFLFKEVRFIMVLRF